MCISMLLLLLGAQGAAARLGLVFGDGELYRFPTHGSHGLPQGPLSVLGAIPAGFFDDRAYVLIFDTRG